MNLLPIASPAAPASGAATENPAAAGSGDFAALVAMLVATASTTLPRQQPPAEGGDASPGSDARGTAFSSSLGSDAPVTAFPASSVSDAPASPFPAPSTPPASAGALTGEPAVPVSTGALAVEPAPRTPLAELTVAPRPPSEKAIPTPPGLSVAETTPVKANGIPFAEAAAPAPEHRNLPGGSATNGAKGRREHPAGIADIASKPGDRPSADGTPPAVADAPRRGEADRPDAAPSDAQPVGGAAPERRTSPAPAAPEPQIPGVPAEEPVGGPDVAVPGKAEGPSAPKISATVSPSAGSANPVVPLVAVNRSVALSPVDVPPATPVAPPAVPEQIVSAVVPLHGRGDGRHEVTLELRPDHLGTIRVEVSVEHQTVHLTIHAADPATSRLLAANLPELRTAFADAGLTAGHLGVGADSGHGAGRWRNPSGTAETDRRPTAAGLSGAAMSEDVDPLRLVHPAATGRLDLLL